MKKFIFILIITATSIQANSQVLLSLIFGDKLNSPNIEFGLDGGGSITKIANMDTKKYLHDWYLGFYFDLATKANFNIYTGVHVKSRLGAGDLTLKDLDDLGIRPVEDFEGNLIDGTYYQKLNTFVVPVLIRKYLKNNIYFEVGPQLGLTYKSFVEFEEITDDRESIIKEYNTSLTNWFEADIAAGAGYKFKKGPGWSFGIQYFYGFTNVYKNRSGTKNSGFFIRATVPIGRKKAEKRRQKTTQKATEQGL
ncbi:MAG: PorT family protein [Chlorobi bacterium]|nr:PorT family protein [Chlorobiota bacterium]